MNSHIEIIAPEQEDISRYKVRCAEIGGTYAAFQPTSQHNKSLQVSRDCASFIKLLSSQVVATRAAT